MNNKMELEASNIKYWTTEKEFYSKKIVGRLLERANIIMKIHETVVRFLQNMADKIEVEGRFT